MLAETLRNLSIPKEKDVIFIDPDPSRWPSLLAANRLIAENVPGKLESRRELLRIAHDYTLRIMDIVCPNNIRENVIAAGHQAIWHHCGIWAKNLTVSTFAEAVDGCGLHLVLDHDVCDTAMVLPRENTDGNWCFERIEVEPKQKTIPLECRQLPLESYLRTFVDTVVKARAGQICSDIWLEYAVPEKNRISHLSNIADLITYLQSVLNVSLHLNMMYLPVSKLSESNAFMDFVTSIIVNAVSFAASYNDAITEQINGPRISRRDTLRPLVLDKIAGLTELPFWLLLPNGERTSLYVRQKETDKIRIGTVSSTFGHLDSACPAGKAHQLRDALQQLGYRLRPKAVSLTLFVRLFLADWFVHGVGGTRYEFVTDYIIADYYGKKPLKFGTTTCTMTLPLSNTVGSHKDNLAQLKHKLHSIKHNPERHIEYSVLRREPVASLLREKKRRIAQATDCALPSNLRKSAWSSLSTVNGRLFEYARDKADMLETKIVEFEKKSISQRVFNYREYFFGLFPKTKLRKVAESSTFGEFE
jgi:hypothetical protein